MDSRRAFLGAVAGSIAVSIAGCAGNGDDGGDETATTTTEGTTTTAEETTATTTKETATEGPTTTTAAETTATTTTEGTTVATRTHAEHGDILTNGERMTLYMFDQDTQGEQSSTCYDGCASAWPPLTVEEAATKAESVTAALTTFERETGDLQVAANGWSLYYFASDEEPGDAKGQGANDVWWVLRPDGTPVRADSAEGAGY